MRTSCPCIITLNVGVDGRILRNSAMANCNVSMLKDCVIHCPHFSWHYKIQLYHSCCLVCCFLNWHSIKADKLGRIGVRAYYNLNTRSKRKIRGQQWYKKKNMNVRLFFMLDRAIRATCYTWISLQWKGSPREITWCRR